MNYAGINLGENDMAFVSDDVLETPAKITMQWTNLLYEIIVILQDQSKVQLYKDWISKFFGPFNMNDFIYQ